MDFFIFGISEGFSLLVIPDVSFHCLGHQLSSGEEGYFLSFPISQTVKKAPKITKREKNLENPKYQNNSRMVIFQKTRELGVPVYH